MHRALVFLILLLLPPLARGDTLAGLLSPPITRQDHKAISTLLHLSTTQQQSADQLFDGYLTAFTKEAQKYEASYRRYEAAAHERPKDHKADFDAFIADFRDYVLKKLFAQHDLLADYRSILNEDQLTTLWPAVDRMMHRKLMGHLSTRTASQWTRVDLLTIIQEANLSHESRALIATQLTEYELALDKVLSGYHHLFWSKTETWLDPSDDDLEKAAVEFGDPAAALNRKYSRWVLELLPPADSKPLRTAIEAKAYDWLGNIAARRAAAEQTLIRAEQLTDLSDESKARLPEIRAKLASEYEAANRWLITAYDQTDAQLQAMTEAAWRKSLNDEKGPFNKIMSDTLERCDQIQERLESDLRPLLSVSQRSIVWPTPAPANAK